jgi:hypothetical protein
MPHGDKLQLDAKQVAWYRRQLDSASQQIQAAGDGAANLAGSVLTCGMVLLVTDNLEGSEVSTNQVIEFLRRFPDSGLSETVEARAFEKSLLKRRYKRRCTRTIAGCMARIQCLWMGVQMAVEDETHVTAWHHLQVQFALAHHCGATAGADCGALTRAISPGERAAAAMEPIPEATEETTTPTPNTSTRETAASVTTEPSEEGAVLKGSSPTTGQPGPLPTRSRRRRRSGLAAARRVRSAMRAGCSHHDSG